MLVDTHCHLTDLSPEDLESTLKRAQDNGVEYFVAIGAGYGFDDNLKTLKIAQTHNNVFCALAMHPHDAKDVNDANFAILEKLCQNEDRVRAIGEIGLDYHYMNSDKNVQMTVLERFCSLAKSAKKPVVIHDRECGNDCVDFLAQQKMQDTGGLVHCFSGDWDLAQKYLDLGFYVSFTGIITFKNADPLREVVKKVPLEKILIETDAPFLTPVPHRGKRNEPAFVKHVAECVAQVKGLSFETIAKTTSENAARLFKW